MVTWSWLLCIKKKLVPYASSTIRLIAEQHWSTSSRRSNYCDISPGLLMVLPVICWSELAESLLQQWDLPVATVNILLCLASKPALCLPKWSHLQLCQALLLQQVLHSKQVWTHILQLEVPLQQRSLRSTWQRHQLCTFSVLASIQISTLGPQTLQFTGHATDNTTMLFLWSITPTVMLVPIYFLSVSFPSTSTSPGSFYLPSRSSHYGLQPKLYNLL